MLHLVLTAMGQRPVGIALILVFCSTGVLSGELPPAQAPPTIISIDSNNVTHEVPSGMLGCHTDLGYSHQIQGYYSQRLYGESFENYTGIANNTGNMWVQLTSAGAEGSFPWISDAPLHGKLAQRLQLARNSVGTVGVANRGFNQEGLVFEVGKNYEGYFFARSEQPVELLVTLEDYFGGRRVLASKTIRFPGGNWSKLDFDLVASNRTSCRGYPVGLPPLNCKTAERSAHACVQCSGQFVIALATPGVMVDLDYAFLQPGKWGRYKEMPLLADSVAWLQRGGYEIIRTGGTFVEADTNEDNSAHGWLWKKLRGPVWERPGSLRTIGGAGLSILTTRGWAMFEAIEMCEKMGIEPVITLHSKESVPDLRDLIDYLFAPTDQNQWGALRAADGHPQPYNISWFEIGNEINTTNFTERAQAMEARAEALGMGGKLRYACPGECGLDVVVAAAASGLGARAYLDAHTGGTSLKNVMRLSAKLDAMNSSARLVVWETNTRLHDLSRMLQEAQDLNDLHRSGKDYRLDQRVESFCMEKSGHDWGLDAQHHFLGDQGAVFFLQNQTWGQPPFWVHAMTKQTLQPLALETTVSTNAVNAFAMRSHDSKTVVLRVVNAQAVPANFTIELGNFTVKEGFGIFVAISLLEADNNLSADNPAYDADRYSPRSRMPIPFEPRSPLLMPARSFAIYTFSSGELREIWV